MAKPDRASRLLNVSDWVKPAGPVTMRPSSAIRPPQPPPAKCATCDAEHEWVWDDDLPLPGDTLVDYTPEPGWYEVDCEWYGEKFHCSRRCYIEGSEYRGKHQT